jgi:hypothetical protein
VSDLATFSDFSPYLTGTPCLTTSVVARKSLTTVISLGMLAHEIVNSMQQSNQHWFTKVESTVHRLTEEMRILRQIVICTDFDESWFWSLLRNSGSRLGTSVKSTMSKRILLKTSNSILNATSSQRTNLARIEKPVVKRRKFSRLPATISQTILTRFASNLAECYTVSRCIDCRS